MRPKEIRDKVEIPNGIEVNVDNSVVTVKGVKGELSRKILDFKINVAKENDKIILSAKKPTKREKRMIGTYKAHLKNLIKGVRDSYVYKLKICSGHFPISVGVKGNIVEIKNFLGERKPRIAKIIEGVNVKIDGDMITVSGVDKETVGQTSTNIEQASRIVGRDKRVFMDRINIISKAGKSIK